VITRTPAAPQVEPAALPRTGSSTVPMVQWGVGLMMLGLGALIVGRERPDIV